MTHTTNGIDINDATVGDERRICSVQKETWLATYPNPDHGITRDDVLSRDFDSAERLKRWRETIIHNGLSDRYIVVAKDHDVLIGFSSAQKGDAFNSITSIYLLPQYQHRGIGSQLLQRSLDWLGRKKDIVLHVVTYNTAGIAFYRHHGFIKTLSGESTYKLPNDSQLPDIEMVLPRLNKD